MRMKMRMRRRRRRRRRRKTLCTWSRLFWRVLESLKKRRSCIGNAWVREFGKCCS
jgi:hypothetical protein